MGIEIVVEDVWEVPRLDPEDVPRGAAPAGATGAGAVGWSDPTVAVPCVVTEAVAPEFAILGLAVCGFGCPAGTSVALLSGRAIDMRESRRNSFSVSKELRLITG